MSGKDTQEIRTMIARRFQSASQGIFDAVVKTVDPEMRTCTVESAGVTYDNVLLHSVSDSSRKGFCFVPAKESMVLVGRIGGSTSLYVTMFSEVDTVLLTVEDKITARIDNKGLSMTVGEKTELSIDEKGMTLTANETTFKSVADGFTITNGSFGLKNTLIALCDAISKLTVSTSVGPSSIPVNMADFQQIKQELEQYLEK